jgi:signal transduction histidine kinase
MTHLWRGLAIRLFTAQALVILAAAATLAVVAAAVGPRIFHAHLAQATRGVDPQTNSHVERAYASANAVSLSLAVLAALIAALTVSAYLARRLGRSVGALAHAAAQLAEGRYTVPAPQPGLGVEFDTLTTAFNAMADRLQAVEATRRQLLADLGHEMRTPLSTIEGYLDAAEDGISVPDEDTVAVLRIQTARLRRLADDLAAVAEEHRLERRPTDLTTVVRTAIAAARTAYAAKGVDLHEQTDPALPLVDADAPRLDQVLTNLLDNALRHTPTGGLVTVTTRHAAGHVEIRVADTGTGIAPDHLPHIFERFYRADTARDRDHGGSGIGLAIVHAIVTAHGGYVRADSPGPGRGATVTITLPTGT